MDLRSDERKTEQSVRGATGDLINKGDIDLGSADKIVKAQAVVNRTFREAKDKNDGSHYGIFLGVVP